jgi:hypothetical protein
VRVIWISERNAEQGRLVTMPYAASAGVPCEQQAVISGGLPGADRGGATAQSGADCSATCPSVLVPCSKGWPPSGSSLRWRAWSPIEASGLTHAEAQFTSEPGMG